MNPSGLDLLLRVATLQLDGRRCEQCGEPLAGARIAVRKSKAEEVVVEAVCGACNQALLVQVKPEAGGIATVS